VFSQIWNKLVLSEVAENESGIKLVQQRETTSALLFIWQMLYGEDGLGCFARGRIHRLLLHDKDQAIYSQTTQF